MVRASKLRRAVAVGLAAGGVATAGCDAPGAGSPRPLDRALFDSTGTWVHAGVSTRTRVDVPPLRTESLAGDTASRSYHLYGMRCGSCHEAPDPSMKTGEHWSFLVPRMQEKTRTAGLIPMTDAEADSIVRFLERHGRR